MVDSAQPRELPPDCQDFQAVLQRYWDGELSLSEVDTYDHAGHCPACQAWRMGADLFHVIPTHTPIAEPLPFQIERIMRRVQDDNRATTRQRRVRWLAAGALAASLFGFGVMIWKPTFNTPNNPDPAFTTQAGTQPIHAPEFAQKDLKREPASIQGEVMLAAEAIVALSQKTTDQTIAPARELFTLPMGQVQASEPPSPGMPPLAELPTAAQVGLEPVTKTTRRAFNLFLRDVGRVTGSGNNES